MAFPANIAVIFGPSAGPDKTGDLDLNFTNLQVGLNGLGNGTSKITVLGFADGTSQQTAAVQGNITFITAGVGITGGGPLTGNVTINLANTAVAPGTYGGAATSPQIVINAQGQITSAANNTIAIAGSQVTGAANLTTIGASSIAVSDSTAPHDGLYKAGANVAGLSAGGNFIAGVDAGGRLLVGTTQAVNTGAAQNINGGFQVHNINSTIFNSVWSAFGWGGPANIFGTRSAGTTVGTNSAVSSGQGLVSIGAFGADGVQYPQAAQIGLVVDSPPSANVMPGRIVLQTATPTTGVLTEGLRVDSNQNILIRTGAGLGNGIGIISIPNAATPPTTNPVGGGILYIAGGSLTYRGSNGSVTVIGPA